MFVWVSNELIKVNKPNKKKILCIETGKIYESINSVKEDGYSPASVSNYCNNKQGIAYGLHWKFV